MALTGLCDEIAAGDDEGKLRKVLDGYERVLKEKPENLVFCYQDVINIRQLLTFFFFAAAHSKTQNRSSQINGQDAARSRRACRASGYICCR